MRNEKKGSEARKLADPKRTTQKVERHIKDRVKELETQEAKLMLDYLHYWTDPVTIEMADFLWRFLVYLRQKKICLVNSKTVFCFPFENMVKLKNLK